MTPAELQSWFEWAGAKLIAMPGRRAGPKPPGTFWPDYSQDVYEVLRFRHDLAVRAAAPAIDEVDQIGEILGLISLCPTILNRRVLHLRALVHPLNGRHLYDWTRLSKVLSSDRRTVRRWHQKGLTEVASAAPCPKICTLRDFLATRLQI